MKPAYLSLALALVATAAAPALACPAPGAAKFKADDVLQEAYVLDRQGEFKAAIAQYKKVLQFFPDNRKAHYLLANCFWRDSAIFDARVEWETVLRMEPDDRWGREARGWLKENAESGDAAGAVAVTVAGGTAGFADGAGKTAKFKMPTSVAVAPSGAVWVADTGNGRIREIAKDGAVSTVLGDGKGGYADGPVAKAKATAPTALAVDTAGNLFFADGHRVRFITPTHLVGTLAGTDEAGAADGDYTTARFGTITALATDAWGNVFVADGATIRQVAPSGATRTLAGAKPGYADGTGTSAQFKSISALKMTDDGLIALDAGNNRIRMVAKDGTVSTLAGCEKVGYLDGPTGMAHFGMLSGVAVGEDGSLFVADAANHAIRHRADTQRVVTVVGGAGEGSDDGRGIMATFQQPTAMAMKGRSLYVVDSKANAIRKVML